MTGVEDVLGGGNTGGAQALKIRRGLLGGVPLFSGAASEQDSGQGRGSRGDVWAEGHRQE